MTAATEPVDRPGSGADLSRRMDRMEGRQDAIEGKVTTLTSVVERVELNQKHGEELAVLRFNGLDTAVKAIDATLERFMGRINAIVSGEVRLPQNEAAMADYRSWRDKVDLSIGKVSTPEWRAGVEERLDAQDVRNGRLDLVGRIALVLFTGNIGAIAAGVVLLLNHKP